MVRAPAGIGQVDGLERQLRTQDRLAGFLRTRREAEGALDFDRTEIKPVMGDGVVKDLQVDASNRARDMIESFMIAANGVTARFLTCAGLGLDPARRARAETVAAHRGDRRRARHHAARRARRRRA